MFKTPPIPENLRQLKAPSGHINPLQYLPHCQNLFGTETLCGDWNGDVLLIAQDFAPASQFLDVLKCYGPAGAWRHNDGDGRYGAGDRTNPRICEMLSTLGRRVHLKGENASTCGVIYINACFFLAEGSGGPSSEAFRRSEPVIDFVFRHASQVKVVACLGKPAFYAMQRFFGFWCDWKTARDGRQPISVSGYKIHALSHPGFLGTINRLKGVAQEVKLAAVAADWAALSPSLQASR